MKFIFDDNRTPHEAKVFSSALRKQWTVSEVIPAGEVSSYLDESARLKWVQPLVSLAFGEATAFYGFGQRISEADDLSAKSWLSVHLLDEARHTEGFSALLNYLYPSYRGAQEKLFANRHAYVFYGLTHRCRNLLEWLICTQIAEVFGRQCYKELHARFAIEPRTHAFFGKILVDENHHIAYIAALIEQRRNAVGEKAWRETVEPFAAKMIPLARNMFEGRGKGAMYGGFHALEIEVSAFCDRAEAELRSRLLSRVEAA